MTESRKHKTMPWSLIVILLLIGTVLTGLGNMDRMIWNWTSYGQPVPGRVVEMHSRRTQPSDTYLTFLPRVTFTDPGGQPREMSVKQGSVHYDFRKGDRVTVLWRPETQTIAIDVPFKRQFGTSVMMWGFTLVGVAMLLTGIWFALQRLLARRKARDPQF